MSLKELIKNKRLTQEKISTKLNYLGIKKNQQQVSEWFSGKRLPNIEVLVALSRILDIPAEDLAREFVKLNKKKIIRR